MPYQPKDSQPIAIASGDPAGVGPEVIYNWARNYSGDREGYIFFGSEPWVTSLRALGYDGRCVGCAEYDATPGEPTKWDSMIAREALTKVARGCQTGQYSAAVTGPVSKENLQASGFQHPGQTEYFAAQWGGSPVMAFVGKRLKVVLATWHIPLHEVSHELSPVKLIRAVTQANLLAQVYGVAEPRIGVCGLNPHAGENGLLGVEECQWIDPLLDDLRRKFLGLSATQAADSLFWRALQGQFDVIVALYHDQGLIPVKTLEFDHAVNVTLGLPYIRTSPDHGTGYSIAGKGIASSSSFAAAVEVARRFIRHKGEKGVYRGTPT